MRRLLILSALLVAAACGGPFPVTCTTEYRYGLTVYVEDASGHALNGADVELVDGSYQEKARQNVADGPYDGAGERAGTYQVTVAHPSYVSQRFSVTLTRDECHVHPQDRHVQLAAN